MSNIYIYMYVYIFCLTTIFPLAIADEGYVTHIMPYDAFGTAMPFGCRFKVHSGDFVGPRTLVQLDHPPSKDPTKKM